MRPKDHKVIENGGYPGPAEEEEEYDTLMLVTLCQAKARLYGMDDASQLWNHTLDEFLVGLGLESCPMESCLYIRKTVEGLYIMLIVYVDDYLYAGNNANMLIKFHKAMSKRFKVKVSDDPSLYIGYEIQQKPGKIFVNQEVYVSKLAETFEVVDAKTQKVPMEPKLILQPAAETLDDKRLYQAVVGSMMYANGTTRPDISFATNQLSRQNANPGKEHLTYGKRVLKYLLDTKCHGLLFQRQDVLKLEGHVDSEYAGDTEDRRSVTGWLVSLNGTPVMWNTKKHPIVTTSSTEAEYVGYTIIAKSVAWIRNVLDFMGFTQREPTIVWVDNQGAIKIAENPKQHGRTKHIDVRYHYIREKILDKTITLAYLSTDQMIADMLTKALDRVKFERFRDAIMETSIGGSNHVKFDIVETSIEGRC